MRNTRFLIWYIIYVRKEHLPSSLTPFHMASSQFAPAAGFLFLFFFSFKILIYFYKRIYVANKFKEHRKNEKHKKIFKQYIQAHL